MGGAGRGFGGGMNMDDIFSQFGDIFGGGFGFGGGGSGGRRVFKRIKSSHKDKPIFKRNKRRVKKKKSRSTH